MIMEGIKIYFACLKHQDDPCNRARIARILLVDPFAQSTLRQNQKQTTQQSSSATIHHTNKQLVSQHKSKV
jgi:hypothetical protein